MRDLSSNSGTIQPIAGVGIACFRGAEVAMIKRANPPRQGEWSIPGGRIELGERAGEAALRELREETGLEAELIGLIDVVDAIFTTPQGAVSHHYVLTDYAAVWRAGEIVAGDDAQRAVFMPLKEALAVVAWDETRRILRRGAEIAQRSGLT